MHGLREAAHISVDGSISEAKIRCISVPLSDENCISQDSPAKLHYRVKLLFSPVVEASELDDLPALQHGLKLQAGKGENTIAGAGDTTRALVLVLVKLWCMTCTIPIALFLV